MGDTTGSILPQSSLDRRLLKAASTYATPQELSDAVLNKLSPAQAVHRLHEILSSATVLDEVEERRLLLMQMSEHMDFMKSKREDPKSWGTIARMYKVLSDQIERANININDVSTKLAEEHAGYFVSGFVLGFEKILKALSERGEIVIDEDEIQELLEVGATASHEYIDRVTSKGEDG